MTGPLGNTRHERFAQELAKGETADAAYVLAGYQANRGNAATLKANQNVRDRVAELQTKAADKAVVTVEGITARLLKIAEKSETSNDAPLLSVARASLMDAAKLNGLIVEKRDLTSSDGSMTPREPTYRLVGATPDGGTGQ
jgi:phage terminase small subunit